MIVVSSQSFPVLISFTKTSPFCFIILVDKAPENGAAAGTLVIGNTIISQWEKPRQQSLQIERVTVNIKVEKEVLAT